jgi:hypothetical protein
MTPVNFRQIINSYKHYKIKVKDTDLLEVLMNNGNPRMAKILSYQDVTLETLREWTTIASGLFPDSVLNEPNIKL